MSSITINSSLVSTYSSNREPEFSLKRYYNDYILIINESLEITKFYEDVEDEPQNSEPLNLIDSLLEVLKDKQNPSDVKKLLESRLFTPHLLEFLDRCFSSADTEKLFITDFSLEARLEILTIAAQLSPEICKEKTPLLIEQLLLNQESAVSHVLEIYQLFIGQGGEKTLFLEMLMSTAQRTKPEQFKENIKKLSEKQRQSIYEVAFIYDNFNIQKPATETIEASSFTINLLWINASFQEEQEFLLPGDEKSLLEKMISPIEKWSKKHPEKVITIWYDSEMTTQKSVEKTSSLVKEKTNFFEFKDIRQIHFVKKEFDLFWENVPVYFRVDLLKVVIPLHLLKTQKEQYCVMTDFDVKPQSSIRLFDERTVHYLKDLGFVLAKDKKNVSENSFMILSKHRQCLKAHQFVILELGTKYARSLKHSGKKIDSQQIYAAYPAVLNYLLGLEGKLGKENTKDIQTKYRVDIFPRGMHQPLLLQGEKKFILTEVVPLKSVSKPFSRFN